jgi:DnaD/phage-associated family protein
MIDEQLTAVIVDAGSTLPVPVELFTDVIPMMTDVAEIQVFLAVVRRALLSGDLTVPLEESAIVRDAALRRALRVVGSGNEADFRIATGLDLAVGRGVLLRFQTVTAESTRIWYVVATTEARASVERMLAGTALPPRTLWDGETVPRIEPERPTIFRLYEQNIGLLSPLIADQLVKAMERYPREWIEDAIGEAVAYNRRSWRYIQRILQNWAATGRTEDRFGNDERP